MVVANGNQIFPTRIGTVVANLSPYRATLTFITNAPASQAMSLLYIAGFGPNGLGTSLYITINNGTIVAPFFCRALSLDFTFGPTLTQAPDRMIQVDYITTFPDITGNIDSPSFFMPPHFSYAILASNTLLSGTAPFYTGQALPVINRAEIGKLRQRIFIEPLATFGVNAVGAFRW